MDRNSETPKGNVAVLLSGRGSNFLSILEHSRQKHSCYRVSLVISDNEQAAGLLKAREEGLPAIAHNPAIYPNRKQYEETLCRHLEAHQIELVCLAGYMRLVGKTLLQKFRDRILNIHPSLLPAFPGLNAQKQALDWGVKISGCTVHFVDSGMDTGPIILQQAIPVYDEDSEETLSERILKQEHRIYPEAISLYFTGRLTRRGRQVTISP